MYGQDILSGMSKAPLEIPHKLSYPLIEKCVLYFEWNFKGILWNSTQNILQIHWKMCILFDMNI